MVLEESRKHWRLVYDSSSFLGMTTDVSSSSRRYLTVVNQNTYGGNDKWITLSALEGRILQDTNNKDKCYCDAQPYFGNRAPLESEFFSQFKHFLEASNAPDFSSANSCDMTSEHDLFYWCDYIIILQQIRNAKAAAGRFKQQIYPGETILKETLNTLLAVTDETCNTEFRVVRRECQASR